MLGVVRDYVKAKKSLFRHFNCPEDYPVRPMLEYNWRIDEREDICILSYWIGSLPSTEAIVMKKENIMRQRDYTMVIAIDCIKIAFIMDNYFEEE